MPVQYNGKAEDALEGPKLIIPDGMGSDIKAPIVFKTQRPAGPDGNERDQRPDAAIHMRYAHTLGLPEMRQRTTPRLGRAIIVGGAPSVAEHLDTIKELIKEPTNEIFAVNWTHTWLLQHGVVPHNCIFFEIDPEPDTVLEAADKRIIYYICSHCHRKTFDRLADCKRILWHSIPNSPGEAEVHNELFIESPMAGGGVGTFTRTLSVALFLGFRHFDIFGCDSSYGDDGTSHAEGYETPHNDKTDGFFVYGRHTITGEVRRFRTLGYLALQVEEFKEYCIMNHHLFSCRVYGDNLLRCAHEAAHPEQYHMEERVFKGVA